MSTLYWNYSQLHAVKGMKMSDKTNYCETTTEPRLDNYTDKRASSCQFPLINAFDPRVMQLAGLNTKTIHCEGSFLPDLTYINKGNQLLVNRSMVNEDFQACRYRLITRGENSDNFCTYSQWSQPFTDTTVLPSHAEFVFAECKDRYYKVISSTYYALIPQKHFDEVDFLNHKKHQVMTAPKETLNIIIVGLDTLPRNQFIRGFSKTYSYLMKRLKSFDLTMHSQLGKNTFPNFLPLFTGQSYDEAMNWWSNDYHLDTFDFVWRNFEQAGYKTLFTEDYPSLAAFHLDRRGFIHPFVRYNSRPIVLSMYSDGRIWGGNDHCVGNQVEMNFQLEYVKRFLDSFPDRNVFAVAMLSKPTHDDPTKAKMFDEHLLHFYQSLNKSGHLNQSLLVSLSDHGPTIGTLRHSVNGDVESKTPYTILTFPNWFLKKYPDIAANLKRNTKRLTSHFDTHATLLDLLYFRSKTPPPLPPFRQGISLFKKIPWDRTCKGASIPNAFCLCGYKSIGNADITSELTKTLSSIVLEAINSKTDKNICAVFELHQVISIFKMAVNVGNSKGMPDTVMYKVKLETTPGYALFEAIVYSHDNSSSWKVDSDIERLNSYKGQANCMDVPENKQYCFCSNK
ncbi:hypothetical protein BsWGS_24898 [Bradybaena similaris]